MYADLVTLPRFDGSIHQLPRLSAWLPVRRASKQAYQKKHRVRRRHHRHYTNMDKEHFKLVAALCKYNAPGATEPSEYADIADIMDAYWSDQPADKQPSHASRFSVEVIYETMKDANPDSRLKEFHEEVGNNKDEWKERVEQLWIDYGPKDADGGD